MCLHLLNATFAQLQHGQVVVSFGVVVIKSQRKFETLIGQRHVCYPLEAFKTHCGCWAFLCAESQCFISHVHPHLHYCLRSDNSPQPHVQCCTTHQPAPRHWPQGPEPVQKRTESCRTAERRNSTGPGCCTADSYTPPSGGDVWSREKYKCFTDMFNNLHGMPTGMHLTCRSAGRSQADQCRSDYCLCRLWPPRECCPASAHLCSIL